MTHSKKLCNYSNDKYKIEHQIELPFEDSIDELAHILIIKYNLPLYIEEGKVYIPIKLVFS